MQNNESEGMKKTPILNIDINSIKDFHKDRRFFDENEKTKIKYWSDGKNVYWLTSLIAPYDESFLVYNDIFAKNHKDCFMQNMKLKNVDCDSFKVLNHCFAKDNKYVWCIGGKFEPVDISTFDVCDDGFNKSLSDREVYFSDGSHSKIAKKISSGYAKDNKHVYCYDYSGKAAILKKASPSSFVSNNDGNFGWDHQFVFFQKKMIKNADAKTWKLLDLNEGFSHDATHVFRFDKQFVGADVDTLKIFSFTNMKGSTFKFLKDKNGIFDEYGNRITFAEIELKYN